MQKKGWIGLENMEFYAHHGVFDEERIIGGKYLVDVFVYTNMQTAEWNDDLSGTINYVHIYNVVHKNMIEPVQLIEHLARKIINDIRLFISKEDKVRIKIHKLNPPLGAKIGASVVEIED